MKTALLKHYGKIFLTILALGLGAYFHVDVSKLMSGLTTVIPAVPAAPVDAGP